MGHGFGFVDILLYLSDGVMYLGSAQDSQIDGDDQHR
jgi:hypothetical protein